MHRDGSDVGRGGIIHAMTTEEIVDDLKQAQAILGTTEALRLSLRRQQRERLGGHGRSWGTVRFHHREPPR